jgi:hypothetical protein
MCLSYLGFALAVNRKLFLHPSAQTYAIRLVRRHEKTVSPVMSSPQPQQQVIGLFMGRMVMESRIWEWACTSISRKKKDIGKMDLARMAESLWTAKCGDGWALNII